MFRYFLTEGIADHWSEVLVIPQIFTSLFIQKKCTVLQITKRKKIRAMDFIKINNSLPKSLNNDELFEK